MERMQKQRGLVRFLVTEGAGTRYIVKTTLECCRTESSFCVITPVSVLPIWWGISLRDFAGKRLNILHTSQIFPLVTSTFFGDLKKDIRGCPFHSDEEVQEWVRLWIHQQPTFFYKIGIYLVSHKDKCINISGNYFSIKQISLSLYSECSVFIWLPLIEW